MSASKDVAAVPGVHSGGCGASHKVSLQAARCNPTASATVRARPSAERAWPSSGVSAHTYSPSRRLGTRGWACPHRRGCAPCGEARCEPRAAGTAAAAARLERARGRARVSGQPTSPPQVPHRRRLARLAPPCAGERRRGLQAAGTGGVRGGGRRGRERPREGHASARTAPCTEKGACASSP